MSYRLSISAAFAFALALVVLGQGIDAPFAGVQEPLQAQWIQDIVSHGDWLLARDYYGLINLKPPLYFWLSALLVHFTGGHVTEPLSRVVSLVAGAALAIQVLVWTTTNVGPCAGWFAYGALLGSYGFASFATVNITDMLMTCLLFTSYSIIYPMIGNAGLAGRAVIAGVTLGLAILTKGPVTVLLWALALVLFLLLTGNKPIAAARWWWIWESVLVAIVFAAPWYIAAAAQFGKEFIRVVIAENVGHALAAASTMGTGPGQKWSFIPLRLLRAALPSVFMLGPLTIAALSGRIRAAVRKPLTFHLAMVIGVVLFFSLVHSVEAYYVLPALPSLAIVISGVCAIGSEQGEGRWPAAIIIRDATLVTIPITMLILLFLSWCYCDSHRTLDIGLRPGSDDWRLAHLYCRAAVNLQPQFIVLVTGTCIGASLSIGGLMLRRGPLTAWGLLVSAIVAVSFWTGTMRTELYQSLTTKSFAAAVMQRVAGARVYTTIQDYEASFYCGYALPIYRRSQMFDMFGRGQLPRDVSESEADNTSSSLYIVVRDHDDLYLSAREHSHLLPVVCADPGVFRKPCLFMIARRRTSGEQPRLGRSSQNLKSNRAP